MTHNRNKTKTQHRAALSRREFSLTERNEMTVHNFESARARHQAEIARRLFPLQGPRTVAGTVGRVMGNLERSAGGRGQGVVAKVSAAHHATEPTCESCRHSRSEPAGEHHELLNCSRYLYQSCRVERTEYGSCGPEAAHYESRNNYE